MGPIHKRHLSKICEYLTLTGRAGIIMNPDKFKFGRKEVVFLGFELTADGVEPGKELVRYVRNLPRPRDISCTCIPDPKCIRAKGKECIKMHQTSKGHVNHVIFSKRILDDSAVFGV